MHSNISQEAAHWKAWGMARVVAEVVLGPEREIVMVQEPVREGGDVRLRVMVVDGGGGVLGARQGKCREGVWRG